jgi:SHS family lactate transporter-like MFS transporter
VESGCGSRCLLAALAAEFVLPLWGWRATFWVGGLPALLALYIRWKVTETEVWKQNRMACFGSIVKAAASNWRLFLSMFGLMALMNFVSHGTDDPHPRFLESAHGFSTSNERSPPAAVRGLIPGLAYRWGVLAGVASEPGRIRAA